MCLAVPVRIVSVEGQEALIELDGIQRRVNISLIEDPRAGDYVLVHAGFAIEKWEDADVAEYRSLIAGLREKADADE